MRHLFASAAIILSLATPAFAQDSAKVILDRHERTIKAADLDGVMADYADNAVLVAPAGVVSGQTNLSGSNLFEGKANIRKFFAVLTTKETNPAVKSMVATYEHKTNDTAIMRWAQFPGTAKEVSGTDVFVIRGGKIITQVVMVNPPKAAAK
jgi:ketosteroid isomerase-like protein